MNTRAVQADENAKVHRSPCRSPCVAVCTPPIAFVSQKLSQDSLVGLILGYRYVCLFVQHHECPSLRFQQLFFHVKKEKRIKEEEEERERAQHTRPKTGLVFLSGIRNAIVRSRGEKSYKHGLNRSQNLNKESPGASKQQIIIRNACDDLVSTHT